MIYSNYLKIVRSSIICGPSFLDTEQLVRLKATAAKFETRKALKVWQVVPPVLSDSSPNNPLLSGGEGENSVTHSWGRLQLECVCTQCTRDPKIATSNASGIDGAIHVAAKWTLMCYKVPVGASQTKLFSLLPTHQEGIIY